MITVSNIDTIVCTSYLTDFEIKFYWMRVEIPNGENSQWLKSRIRKLRNVQM